MKRRRLDAEALVDDGVVPTDAAALQPAPLVVHTWVDIDDPDEFLRVTGRIEWNEDRWHLCATFEADGSVAVSVGCRTRESNLEEFQAGGWLPRVAAMVVATLLRLSVGYIFVEMLTYEDPLCLVPPGDGGARRPVRLVAYTTEPGQLLQYMLFQKVWLSSIVSEDQIEELEFGRVVRASLAPPRVATNVFARDCLLAFATPNVQNPRLLHYAFPGDTALADTLFAAAQDENALIYEVQADSLPYPWSSLRDGAKAVQAASGFIDIFSVFSDEATERLPLSVASRVNPADLDSAIKPVQPVDDQMTEPINLDDLELPEEQPLPRPFRHGAPPPVIDLFESSPETVINIDDDDERRPSSSDDCELTKIQKLKDLTGVLAEHVTQRGWGDLLVYVAPWINKMDRKTLRFEHKELFNNQTEEWQAREASTQSLQKKLLFYNKVFVSRLLHLMLHGHLMNYATQVVDPSLTVEQAMGAQLQPPSPEPPPSSSAPTSSAASVVANRQCDMSESAPPPPADDDDDACPLDVFTPAAGTGTNIDLFAVDPAPIDDIFLEAKQEQQVTTTAADDAAEDDGNASTDSRLLAQLDHDLDADPELREILRPDDPLLVLKERLYPHQLEAVKWMRRREREGPKLEDGYYLRAVRTHEGLEVHYDLSSGATKPLSKMDRVRGGILGDEMGLGKTLQTLVTCLHDPFTREHYDARANIRYDALDMRLGCTLLICPLSVIENWRTAIAKFTAIPETCVCVYHGAARARISATEVAKHIFVITSYHALVKQGKDSTDLHHIHWRRVVLDEGHEIRNPRAKRTKAILKLIYDIGWIVTGTPLQNSLTDIQPLLQFLKVQHLDIPDLKKTAPCEPGEQMAALEDLEITSFLRFTFALRSLILRRTKAMVAAPRTVSPDPMTEPTLALPPKTFVELRVELTSQERDKYEALRVVTRQLAESFKGKFLVLSTLVNHMRLLCGSEEALGPVARRALETAYRIFSGDESLLHQTVTQSQIEKVLQSAAVRELLRSEHMTQETVCPICYDVNVDCVTQCSHPFHRACILRWFNQATDRSCPYCRKPINDQSLLNLQDIRAYTGVAAESPPDNSVPPPQAEAPSSKVQAVVQAVKDQIAAGHPTTVTPGPVKVVIFSSFVRMLRILERAFDREKIPTVLFTGGLTRTKRNKLISDFQTSPRNEVFLASYGAGSTGVTLTAANAVYLLDPWWNPFMEDQAIDRVHRISQTRPVTVYRVVVDSTVEDGVIACQKRKRVMSQRVVGGVRAEAEKSAANATVTDLEEMLAG